VSLVVVRAAGLCTVQDLGRRGHMHEAVPPGGALVRDALVAANRAAGNPDGVPAIEVLGQMIVRATADVVIATDREGPRMLDEDDELSIASGPSRCTYLAIRGGVTAREILGGRGTMLCAGLGAPLRAGDEILSAGAPRCEATVPLFERDDRPIRALAGPDTDAFDASALAQLCAATYRISPTSNRVGTRLEGATLQRFASYREQSRPMVIGAIEVPRDGQPIVLGPEHPTTGGYPIVAVIATAELDRFFSIRLGGNVRFTLTR
jgi:biotin-dependent carboxylase-like uncharacterized protein